MREIIERGTLRRTIILDEEYEMVILNHWWNSRLG